jgi:hypothetical protein
LSLAVAFLLLATIFALCGRAVWRHWVRKKWMSAGSQFMGRGVYSQFVNKDKDRAMEEVIFLEEEKREQDFDADGFKPPSE